MTVVVLWSGLSRLRREPGLSWLVPGARRMRPEHDPFEVLRLQMGLARLEAEIATIRQDTLAFARAHHLRAAVAAYDDLLAEACRLAGIRVDACQHEAAWRDRAEALLQARGWFW